MAKRWRPDFLAKPTWCKLGSIPDRTVASLTIRRRIRARGQLAGQAIDTTVDSRLAKYYLERHLQGFRDDAAFDRLIDEIHAQSGSSLPSAEYLKYLSSQFSTDFATLYLARYLLGDPANQVFHRLFDNELRGVRARADSGAQTSRLSSESYTFLFVPGWVYESVTETGANFARPRQMLTALGIDNELIPIAECGTIEDNAEFIATELSHPRHRDKNIILVSASSGGSSTATALGRLLAPRELGHVKAWVNVGGLLQGSVMADRAVRAPRRWITKAIVFARRWNYESIVSMTTERSRTRYLQISVPRTLFCVNYVGIPLSGQITRLARNDYRTSRKAGPNDGVTLIADSLIPHGVTVAIMGIDHFHVDRDADVRAVALAQAIMKHLEGATRADVDREVGPETRTPALG
jgi:hypothetical protein